MVKTVTWVEIRTQMDTSGFDQGTRRISRAVEEIGKSATGMNESPKASCGYVDMLLNAFHGLDYATAIIASLGGEIALLSNTVDSTTYAAISLGTVLSGIADRAGELERVAAAMRNIRTIGDNIADKPIIAVPELEAAEKRSVVIYPHIKAGIGAAHIKTLISKYCTDSVDDVCLRKVAGAFNGAGSNSTYARNVYALYLQYDNWIRGMRK